MRMKMSRSSRRRRRKKRSMRREWQSLFLHRIM